MPTTRTVPDFLPSAAGLHFENRFPAGPTLRFGPLRTPVFGIGDAAAGLCGGMCFYVRGLFRARQPIPPDTAVPANGSSFFGALVREQIRSLRYGIVPIRFWRMSRQSAAARTARTRDREWPKVRAALDDGRLAVIGLVRAAGADPRRLTANHQVVAYGYEDHDGDVRIRIYDPNWPDRDNVSIPLDGVGRQSTGEILLGVVALD
jgi:hypothetical protein